MDEVAERAGYTKGAVYSNFASKEDLFFGVYQRRIDHVLTDVVPGLRQAGAVRAFDTLAMARSSGATVTTVGWRSSSSSGRMYCGIPSFAAASPKVTRASWSR